MTTSDDVIFLSLLLGSIGFGTIYRQLSNERVNRKRWIGSGVGILLVMMVSGYHTLHVLFAFSISTTTVLAFDVRQAHILTMVFMLGYLFVYRLMDFLQYHNPPGQSHLILMVYTLKIVGLAFERSSAAKELKEEEKKTPSNDDEREIIEINKAYLEDVLDMNVEDVFHYCFNYVSVLTGPYYSYRTFRDYFTARYWQFVNCELLMMERLKWVPIYGALIITCSYIWPISYVLTDEFYYERTIWYRIWYAFPSFFIFRMRIYIGMTLSECVCIMCGFGAYPEPFESRPGGGPREVIALERPVGEAKFDFETIHMFDAITTETCFTVREAMRSFHMCTQYWLAYVVYKRFPNKGFRTFATLLVSAFWQGSYPGYFISMVGMNPYLYMESLWDKAIRLKLKETPRVVLDYVFWFSKTFIMSYLGMAYLLMTYDKIMTYYESVNHAGVIWSVLAYILGLMAHLQFQNMGEATPTPSPEPETEKEESELPEVPPAEEAPPTPSETTTTSESTTTETSTTPSSSTEPSNPGETSKQSTSPDVVVQAAGIGLMGGPAEAPAAPEEPAVAEEEAAPEPVEAEAAPAEEPKKEAKSSFWSRKAKKE